MFKVLDEQVITEFCEKLQVIGNVIAVDHNPQVNLYRVTTLTHVTIFVGSNDESNETLVMIHPTQFAVTTPKAIENSNSIIVDIFNCIMEVGFNKISIGRAVFLKFSDHLVDAEQEFKEVISGDEADALISNAMVTLNYDEEIIKKLANNALASTLQEKVQNKAQQIMQNPSLQIQTQSKDIVDLAGNKF